MSKNHSSSSQQTDNLKARYQEILADEQKKRPPYKDQSFFQKLGAQATRLGSAYCTLGSVALAFSPYFFMAPAYYGLASNLSQDYDKLRNPEEFYQQNALERLAAESGMLNGISHRLKRIDLLTGKDINSDYVKRMDQILPLLCEKLGIEEVKYKRPYESFDKGMVGRGLNKVAGVVSDATSKIPSPFSKAPEVADEELLKKLDSYNSRLGQPVLTKQHSENKPQSLLGFIAQSFLNMIGFGSKDAKVVPVMSQNPYFVIDERANNKSGVSSNEVEQTSVEIPKESWVNRVGGRRGDQMQNFSGGRGGGA